MRPILLSLLAATLLAPVAATSAELPPADELHGWIEEMKAAQRGPFRRIRWFCKDGTILPPEPYACVPHGGGSQHGEWSERTVALREGGFRIANVYADLDEQALLAEPEHGDLLAQMLVEQFLIEVDDGWILRGARFYRGALQEEGERAGARRLLLAMAAQERYVGRDIALLRTAARLLRHGAETSTVSEVRRTAASLSDIDPGFRNLRIKIHVRPEASDALAVREYASDMQAEAAAPYLALADAIDQAYAPAQAARLLRQLSERTETQALTTWLDTSAQRLASESAASERLVLTAALLASLRERLPELRSPALRLALVDASLALESEHFVAATELGASLASADRQQRVAWLRAGVEAAYGVALIGQRQRTALLGSLAALSGPEAALSVYKRELDYVALLPGWGAQRLRYHFGEGLRRIGELEPKAELFIPDQLRASPLFFVAANLDGLLRDANRLAGVRNEFFGEDVGAGLRSLNPGLARGRLQVALAHAPEQFESDGVYVLPETIAELPPVAGILTAGEGNPLSHVQLLARNLGIPNVAVDTSLLPRLHSRHGAPVVLAVSPAGSVQIAEDGERFEAVFGAEQTGTDAMIRPDLGKLNLADRSLEPLSSLRADDSGRTVGPKAAKLGELLHHYPHAVADGLAIPFGVFRRMLEQPFEESGMSAYDWMVREYRRLESLPAGSAEHREQTDLFRARLHDWISSAQPDAELVAGLRSAMAEVFGPDGSYGVFVRSDTNVEDLPGFTGAGLNLTVPNVVGVDAVLRAIPRVWASPFTERAFSWRQSHMSQPEHVYPAVLLLRSVPVQKSGVMVTQDVESGSRDWLSVAVNEGVGGAVDGQAAESLRINVHSGEVRLMAEATAASRRLVSLAGGVDRVPVSGAEEVLLADEIAQLVTLAKELPSRFPEIADDRGNPAPADIEFGFLDGELKLFQIRPFLESQRARGSNYLKSLDAGLVDLHAINVRLDRPVGENSR